MPSIERRGRMESSGSSVPEAQPLVETKKRGAPRALLAILVAIIIVLAAALAYVSLRTSPGPAAPGPSGTLSVQSATPTAQQGSLQLFTLTNLRSDAYAIVHFGDGSIVNTNVSSFTHIYNTPGTYLIYADEYGSTNGTKFANTANALIKVTVVASVPFQLAQYVSVPTIYFNTTQNPSAPIVAAGSPVYLYGAFGEKSQLRDTENSFLNITTVGGVVVKQYTNTSDVVSIDHYSWDFGNGQTRDVSANGSTSLPATNPVTATYANQALYTALLTLTSVETLTVHYTNLRTGVTFTNTTVVNTYASTVGVTLAVGTWALFTSKANVPSPGVITEIVNSPGGPFSFDPQIDYETTGFEVVVNTQATLIFYNGSSTTDWFPYIASAIPTVANGGISSDFKNYTFHIRSGMKFSNGDPITAYDVWYSTIRAMLFGGGTPGTPDWIIAQYLIPRNAPPFFVPFSPIVTAANKQVAFNAIMAGVSCDIMATGLCDRSAQSVIFHLSTAQPASLFFTAINDPLGMGILDASWLISIGAGITFSPDGFLAYQQQSVEGFYNTQVQFHPVASGPYQINTYVPSTTVVLTPNPGFPGIANIPKQVNTIILNWVSSPAVGYQLFASGQGDIVTGLPPPYFQTINNTLVRNRQAVIQGPFSSITEFFAVFNVNTTISMLASAIGPGFTIPADYFANTLVREAFAYAWNYTNYVDNILGNKKYGFNFGTNYCGVIVQGLPYYVPPTGLTGCPSFDLAKAKSLLYQSGMYNVTVNFPVVVPTGDTTDFTASIAWARYLNLIDPHITMSPVNVNFDTIIGLSVPGANPMPLYFLGWIADYPYPSDYTDAMYLVGGTYPGPNGWDAGYLSGLASVHPAQASLYTSEGQNYTALNNLIVKADTDTSPSQAAADYAAAEQIAVKLYMYVYTEQATGFWIVKTYITPYQGNWGYQENPTIGAGADSTFFWWVKG
jgi:peptide/nickel transport system substrate-binding protein